MSYPLILASLDSAEQWPVTVPTRWADVSLAQFVTLYTQPDAAPVEVLCQLPAGTLERLSVQAVEQLATLLTFATDTSPVLEALPTPGLPDIGSLSYGTLLLAQQYLTANPARPASFYMPRLLALYRMELVYGKYLAAKVTACEAALLATPVTETYPDAAFFLASLRRLQRGTPPTSPTTASPAMKSSTRAVKSWAKGSGRFSAWMRRLAAPS